MTNAINVAALGMGGLDTTTLVSSLVAIEQQPLTLMQNKQQQEQGASSIISGFSSALSSLATAAAALSAPASFQFMAATSSDSSIVATTNTTNGTPEPGQWTVDVNSVAQTQRTISNGASDPTADLGMSGTMTVTVGSGSTAKSATINLAGESLNGIATQLATSGLPMQASVVYDASQPQNPYRLLVSGLNTGAANAISFDESSAQFAAQGFSFGLDAANDPNYNANATLQQAQDASVQIDGINGYTVTSSTNQITTGIPGVTLAVTQPTTQTATISIGSDPTALESNVQSFVSAYNTVVTGAHSAAGYGKQNASNPLLQGDVAMRSSLHQLEGLLAQSVPGATGAYTTLASVGITLNDDGTLAFDQSTFASALQADPTSVQRLFVSDPNTNSTGVMATFQSTITTLTDPVSGVVGGELKSFDLRDQALTKEMTQLQTQISTYQTQLQKEFTQMNNSIIQYKQVLNAIAPSSSSSGSSNNVL